MCADFLSAAGPLWGPDFVVVTVTDAGREYHLQVYPDANNPHLKAAGLQTQYYFEPSAVYLAKRIDSNDYDFGFTLFKGLMTSDRDVGVTGPEQEMGGGWCTFSTTFAVPDGVLAQAVQKLQAKDHSEPNSRIAPFFNWLAGDPAPGLGIISISEDDVTINVADLAHAVPQMWISAVGTGKGSVEAAGHNSFLVTCNQLAAGAIASSLKAGGDPPFTIQCNLKEQFYIDGCSVTVDVDVDKIYDAVSAALSAGGFLGIDSATLNAAYSSMETTGGVHTDIRMNSGILSDDQKKWIQGNVDDMRKRAYDLVKNEIFDWDPSKGDTPASADRGLVSSLFGGSAVSLKANYQRRSVHFHDSFTLEETIAVNNQISGDLNDLMPAVRANLNKYLAVIDIGEFFQKVQVAATCAVSFAEKLPDGTDISDPIQSVELVPSYPDFNQPLNQDGTPNLVPAEGYPYTLGQTQQPAGAATPIIWTADNAKQAFNAAWLRLANDAPGWHASNVRFVQTLVYSGDDPRVALANGGVTWTSQHDSETEHAPILTASAIGYVYVHFVLDRVLPKDNVTLTVTLAIGDRQDTLTITKTNQKNILWELFSDKFFDAEEFTYSVQVEVVGPSFTDNPVSWQHAAPISVAVPKGRIKYLNPFKLVLPPVPPDQKATVDQYIQNYQVAPADLAEGRVPASQAG
jgi:hypothetical protein